MNSRWLSYLMVVCFSCCHAEEALKGPPELIMHRNQVTFRAAEKQPPLKISFVLSSYKITSGQPWGGIEVVDGVDIFVNAGRHNSAEVVGWVRDAMVVPFLAENAAGTTSGLPVELNFAIKGSLQFYDGLYGQQLVCPDVIMAQGHFFLSNNWWLFSNSSNSGRPDINCRGSCTLIHCANSQVPGSSYLVRITSASLVGEGNFNYFVSLLGESAI